MAKVAARVLNKIMGPDPVSYALVQSVLRGPVELLPSNGYRTVFLETTNFGTNLDMGDVYRIYALESPPGIVPKIRASNIEGFSWNANDAAALRARIAGAQLLQATLGARFHPNTVVIFGDDLRTDTNFSWTGGVVDKVDGIEDLKLKITQDGIDPNPDQPGKFPRGDGYGARGQRSSSIRPPRARRAWASREQSTPSVLRRKSSWTRSSSSRANCSGSKPCSPNSLAPSTHSSLPVRGFS